MRNFAIGAILFSWALIVHATDACDDYEFAKSVIGTNQKYEFWTPENEHIANAEDGLKYWEPRCKKLRKQKSLPGARIGMTMNQVLNKTSWGEPQSVNRTTTRYGVREQWVYGNGNYLYFENGKLTAIQN